MVLSILFSLLFAVSFLNIALIHANDELNRIVGGVPVGSREYVPYQISLQLLKDGVLEHHCGGSILSPRHILTAAHCVDEQKPRNLIVYAGIRDLNDTTRQTSKVISYKIHNNYEELRSGDIAIVYIHPPLNLDGRRVDKIDIDGYDMVRGGLTLLLTGWGATNTRGNIYPNRMQKLLYKTISNKKCKKFMKQVTGAELCAMEAIFEKGSCLADSGGPLVMRRGRKLFQVGIVSYGTHVCAINYPDVYTRVSAYYDWIKDRMT